MKFDLDLDTMGVVAKDSSSPPVNPVPDRDHFLAAINHEIPVMRRGGHASVIRGNPQPGADRQINRVSGIDRDDAVLLIGLAHDCIAEGRPVRPRSSARPKP